MRGTFSNDKFARYGLEAAMIVFSVLLALYLDNVFEDRRENRTINELVGHVAEEMQSNLGIVEEWLPYHQGVIAEIDRYLSSEELQQNLLTDDGIDYGRLMERGLIQDFYSSSSWLLAQQSEITSRLDFEITYTISQAYLSQQNVNLTLQRFSDFVFDRETHDPEQLTVSLRILRNLLQELSGQQAVLRQNYRDALLSVQSQEKRR